MSLIACWGSKKKRLASGDIREISRSKFKTAPFVAFANLRKPPRSQARLPELVAGR